MDLYMKFLFSLLVIFSLLSSCSKDDGINSIIKDKEGVVTYLPPLWSLPLHEDGNPESHSLSVTGNNVVNEEDVLIITNQNSTSRYLTLVSSETGEILWKWNDWYIPESESFKGRFTITHNNVIHWITGTRHYWVDLENGQTVKKYRGQNSYAFNLRTLGSHFFGLAKPKDTLTQYQTTAVFRGDFYDEEPEMVLLPKLNLEHAIGYRIGGVTSVIPVIENGDTLLITAYQDIFPNWSFQSYLGLYNLTRQNWVYEKVPLCEISQKGVLYHPLRQVENTVITNVARSLICYNFYTGEKVWEKEFPHDFSFSGFDIYDGILVGSCENKILYGMDVHTGQLLWTGEGAGTNSKLENRIMDGVLYFGGGSSGYFHAVDIYTGKTLWKLDPHKYEGDEAFWTWSINVVPGRNGEKGKVIIQNARNAYCFEAVH